MYLPILTYHRLLEGSPNTAADPKRISVSQAQFRSHLAVLSRLGYHSVSLADYPRQLREGRPAAPKSFAITFDDGYEEVLTLGLPILKEFGFTATIFAVPGQLAGCNAWDDGRAKLLSVEQYRTLMNAGMTIGAHTCSHVHLPAVDAATAKREIEDSKSKVEAALDRPATLFAYPYGEYSPDVETLVQKAGFEAAFATDRASRDHSSDLFSLRRVVIFPRTNVWQLLWKVQRWYPRYQDRRLPRVKGL